MKNGKNKPQADIKKVTENLKKELLKKNRTATHPK